ncbi:MAG: hypothetical protein FWF55_03295 [Treponema sp.]|nr:hypothetical protein [Treponema sp.]
MAIQPIDLQTMFSQMDKVAKTQTAQREEFAMHQSMQGVHIQKKTEAHIQSVNEAQNTGDDGTDKIKDRPSSRGRRESDEESEKETWEEVSEEDEAQSPFISDPRLGNKIDISL